LDTKPMKKKRKIKEYKAGDLLAMRVGVNEDPAILQWANIQSNIGDAFRYFIEEDIRKNGIRNLSEYISATRPPLTTVQPKTQPPSLLRN